MGIGLSIIIISGIILYLSWISNSIREIKQKLSNIEGLLKDRKD